MGLRIDWDKISPEDIEYRVIHTNAGCFAFLYYLIPWSNDAALLQKRLNREASDGWFPVHIERVMRAGFEVVLARLVQVAP